MSIRPADQSTPGIREVPQGSVDLATKLTQRTLKPLAAPSLAEGIANYITTPTPPETPDQAHAAGHQAKGENPLDYERGPNYPPTGITELAPAIDLGLSLQGGYQAAKLGVGATKLAVAGAKAIKGKLFGNALKDAVEQIKALPASVKGQLELGLEDTASAAPVRQPKFAPSGRPLMEEDIAGATLNDIVPGDKGLTLDKALGIKPATPTIEVYSKGTMGGGINPNTGKPLPKTNIWGVKGDPKEIEKLGFGPEPASIPEEVLRKNGIPLPGDAPVLPPKPQATFGSAIEPPKSTGMPIQFSKKDIAEINKKTGLNLQGQPEQLNLFKRAPRIGEPTTLTTIPTPPPLVKPLPVGADKRIGRLTASTAGPDVPGHLPATNTSELAATYAPKDIATTIRDQAQTGFTLEAQADHQVNQKVAEVLKRFKVKPGTDESAVISAYGRSPDKIAARQILDQTVGTKRAQELVNADAHMRIEYDSLIKRLNEQRAANGEKLIPYKQDYHTSVQHFNTLSQLGLDKLFGTAEGEEIAQRLLTDTEQKAVSKFQHLANIAFNHLKKQGPPTVEDAVQGFNTYVKQAERKLALQPFVNELRASSTAVEKQYPNLAKHYINLADHIAGVVPSLDASIQSSIGPEGFRSFMSAVNNIKGNLIVGNMNVPFAQLLVLPTIASDVPVVKAMKAATAAIFNPRFRNFIIESSPTIQLRLEGVAATKLAAGPVTNLLNKPSNLVDLSTLVAGKSAKFFQLIDQGVPVKEALKASEEFISRTQATLSKINTAPILRSQAAQATLPFMNQVLSQQSFLKNKLLGAEPLGTKAVSAAKFAATAQGLKLAFENLLGQENPKEALDSAQIIPFGGTLEQGGFGGPAISTVGGIVKGKTAEDKLLAVFKAAMLLQTRIPAGLQVAKAGIGAYRSMFPKREE